MSTHLVRIAASIALASLLASLTTGSIRAADGNPAARLGEGWVRKTLSAVEKPVYGSEMSVILRNLDVLHTSHAFLIQNVVHYEKFQQTEVFTHTVGYETTGPSTENSGRHLTPVDFVCSIPEYGMTLRYNQGSVADNGQEWVFGVRMAHDHACAIEDPGCSATTPTLWNCYTKALLSPRVAVRDPDLEFTSVQRMTHGYHTTAGTSGNNVYAVLRDHVLYKPPTNCEQCVSYWSQNEKEPWTPNVSLDTPSVGLFLFNHVWKCSAIGPPWVVTCSWPPFFAMPPYSLTNVLVCMGNVDADSPGETPCDDRPPKACTSDLLYKGWPDQVDGPWFCVRIKINTWTEHEVAWDENYRPRQAGSMISMASAPCGAGCGFWQHESANMNSMAALGRYTKGWNCGGGMIELISPSYPVELRWYADNSVDFSPFTVERYHDWMADPTPGTDWIRGIDEFGWVKFIDMETIPPPAPSPTSGPMTPTITPYPTVCPGSTAPTPSGGPWPTPTNPYPTATATSTP